MTDTPILRLSATPNAPVVQLPERKHPGVVIQGDSLKNLCKLCEEADEQFKSGNIQEGLEIVQELHEILRGYQTSYNDAVSPAKRPG